MHNYVGGLIRVKSEGSFTLVAIFSDKATGSQSFSGRVGKLQWQLAMQQSWVQLNANMHHKHKGIVLFFLIKNYIKTSLSPSVIKIQVTRYFDSPL